MIAGSINVYPKKKSAPLKYSYDFDVEGNNPAGFVLRMVRDGSNVLDVGAGPGSITRELKQRKNCRVTALDIDQGNVELLAEICDAAHQVDLNDSAWLEVLGSKEKFDAVIATDVLEHLWNPWETLSLLRTLTKEEGDIILSIPHASHCAVAACLINRDFEYGNEGLLDRTHIRFFGLKNIQSLVNDAGLNVVEAQLVVRAPESTDLAAQWNRLSQNMKECLSSYQHANVYQVVLKAKHQNCSNKNIILENIEQKKPRSDPFVRFVPNTSLRMFLRRHAKASLGIESRRRARWLAAQFGIRF